MGAFWCKQPNGKYCRFSTVVDSITDYNYEKQDILNLLLEQTKEDFERDFENGCYNKSFDDVIESFCTNNMSLEEMINICVEMGVSDAGIERLKRNIKQREQDMLEAEEGNNK